MTSFTIFGTGNMGSAIAGIVSAGGSSVQHIGRETDATVSGEVVVLAVPYPALDGILAAYADQFAGKVVVDITNPLDFETFDALVTPADGSAAAELAAALPQSRVVKAFNTTFAATLATKTVGGSAPTTVLVAGDDAEAKALLIDAVIAGGVKAIDAGALKRARELEAIGFLQLTLAVSEKIGWTGGFALLP
ncbi:dinucleotide-binding protein [Cnuibacter physcomitrellae]|uniref:Diguanylate cyclase n=1 Tax=Cnuibacter physcomitrellae TaxID=1619308 RepID=A0A1X9LTR5_9MICO|nr:NADPH-dependent F420 reductase [Cnuibacter physcomitrellae]ARJ06589.1 diguanylate cyclase [Cnuibacter physcomitrellae]GGI38363.1 dinucleotide-binding protein [Cnuibacter physcomitrellae]